MKLKPLGDRLIVRAVEEEETTASGIVLPDTAKEKPQRGEVLAVGDGKVSEETGKRVRAIGPAIVRMETTGRGILSRTGIDKKLGRAGIRNLVRHFF